MPFENGIRRPTRAVLEGLYRRYASDVYHYALAVLRNPADAEDVTQTTFLNAYRAMQRGEQPLKPQNWLIKIAHNAARSRYQRVSRRVKEVPLDDHIEQLSVAEEDKPDVEAVLEALGRLPMNQRAALVLRELEGRTYAEIADTLNVSVPAVETLIFRARRALRLKASSVRVLSVVQLPVSLSKFLEGGGGGVAAGGSALAGYGLLFKAAVAVVAGVVATSLSGDHSHPAQAAPQTGTSLTAPPWTNAVQAVASRGVGQEAAGSTQPVARRAARPDGVASRKAVPGSADGAATSATGSSTESSASSAVTNAVTSTVSSVTSSLPKVTTPSVSVPQLPQPPALPTPPPVQVPTLPPVPSPPVQVPSVPPVPPPPPLP